LAPGNCNVWRRNKLLWVKSTARAAAAPVDLLQAMKLSRLGESIEFMKVSAQGRFLHESEKHLLSTYEGTPAWEVVTPLLTATNTLILVDRGVIPEGMKDAASRPSEVVKITGVIRTHREGRGPFTPENDVKSGIWLWWDVPAMLQYTMSPPRTEAAPFVLHLTPGTDQTGFPRPLAFRSAIPNNHLQYAITWFSLAMALAIIASLLIAGAMKKPGA
jgi:surfeit locus 1 family protein